jgi:hypothetical protein
MITAHFHGSCPNGLIPAYKPLAAAFAQLQQNLAFNNTVSVRVFFEAGHLNRFRGHIR